MDFSNSPISPCTENSLSSLSLPPSSDIVSITPSAPTAVTTSKCDAVRYHCNYCGKDISNVIRVKCAVCADFDLCVQCFSVGVEIGGHKNNHDYHIMDILNFPLFNEHWGADEELLLLEGIEMYGLGNWGDVSDHVGTKSSQACKEHYFSVYINVGTSPLPDLSKILTTSESLQKWHSLQTSSRIRERTVEESVPVKEEKKEKKEKPMEKTSATFSFPELAGFMPLRGDFETEYENDAEFIINEMTFGPEDSKEEKELKLKILELYNRKLDERIRRKKFILERGLLDSKKRKPKEDKDIYDRVKVFARIMDREEHEEFLSGLIAERNLRKKIEELKKYRQLGIHSFEEIEQYELDRKRKEAEQGHLLRKTSSQREVPLVLAERARASKYRDPESIERRDREGTSGTMLSPPSRVRRPLDITGTPGFELLSESERLLCSNIRLYPQQYMLIKGRSYDTISCSLTDVLSSKETLMRESMSNGGYLKRATARNLIKIGREKSEGCTFHYPLCFGD